MDAVLNHGAPAPIDVQVSGMDLKPTTASRKSWRAKFARSSGVSDVLIPQDIDYPALKLDVDRENASAVGLTPKEVVDNVITALTSDGMIAPSYWVDPKNGNDYLLTVQYPENQVKNLEDLRLDAAARDLASAANAAGFCQPRLSHPVADGSGPLSTAPDY